MTTNFATGGHLVVNGAGTLDIQGDNSGLINAMQIGTQNAAGPTIIVHDAGSLGSVITGQITTFFNSGTITNQRGTPITFASSLLSSIGGTGTFPATYAGADMEFQGSVNLFRPTGTTPNRITVNNNVTFSGGWNPTVSATGTIQSGDTGTLTNTSGVIVNGTGTLTLSTTAGGNFTNLSVPLAVDGATLNFNGVDPNINGTTNFNAITGNTVNLVLSAINNGKLNLGTANAFAGSGTATAANVVLSGGGQMSTGGFSQTFGTLALPSSATLDLGSGASIVQFGDSHYKRGTAYCESAIGAAAAAGNGTDQLLWSRAALRASAAQLAAIHFTGLPTGAKFVTSGTNGEVVPLSTTPLLIGDLNGDSHVNATDIATMLTALTDLNAYKTAHPTLDSASLTDIADLNSDGAFNNLDLQGLITYLKTGHGSLEHSAGAGDLYSAGDGLAGNDDRRAAAWLYCSRHTPCAVTCPSERFYKTPSGRHAERACYTTALAGSCASTPSTIFRSFGSAIAAACRISLISTGLRLSGKQTSVIAESPSTRMPP